MKNNQFFSKYYQLGDNFIKSEDKKNGRIYVEGIISTENEDAQGEIMRQSGMDFSYFKKRGYINNEHKQGAENMLGAPTELKSMKYKGVPATFMKGYLFADNPKVQEIITSMNAMKAADCDRGLGFSVEGAVIERDKNNPNIITKSKILNVSLVASPANPDATLELCKSLYAQLQKEDMSVNEEINELLEDESMNEEMSFDDKSEIEEDTDGKMTLQNLMILKEYTDELLMMIKPEDNLPEWVQQHITLASDYVHSAAHYLKNQKQMMSMQQKLNELNEIAAGYMSKGKYEGDDKYQNRTIIANNELEAITRQSIEEEPVLIHNTPIGEKIEQELHGIVTEEEAKQIIATIIRMYPNRSIEEYKTIFSQLIIEMMQKIRGDE
jgi:hypothetical protein